MNEIDEGRTVRNDNSAPSTTGRDDAMKLVTIGNAALVGVPAAYVTSGSIMVTGLAAVAAILLVALYLRYRRR